MKNEAPYAEVCIGKFYQNTTNHTSLLLIVVNNLTNEGKYSYRGSYPVKRYNYTLSLIRNFVSPRQKESFCFEIP